MDTPFSSTSSISALSLLQATTTNIDHVTSSLSLPYPKKDKKKNPQRSTTFTTFPISSENHNVEDVSQSSSVRSPCISIERPVIVHDKTNSRDQMQSVKKGIIKNPLPNMRSRFRLPPTPLTSPEYTGDNTWLSFSNRQIARSVDGLIQVEVGFASMS